jgi:hypothetical protein
VEDPALSVSIERLVQARGVELHDKKDRLVGACPFHDGADDGLRIDPSSNTWSCSACNVTEGGPVEWLAKAEGISRTHAAELIKDGRFELDRQNVGPTKGAVPKHSTVRTLGLSFTAADTDAAILDGVVSFYTDALKDSAEAHAFLEARGIAHLRLIDKFKLGFSNKTLGLRIPKTNRVSGRQLRSRLQDLGVLRKDTGHEHMTGCIVVPLFDIAGDVVNLYGRRIDRAQRGAPDELWANPSKRGLINVEAFKASELVVAGSILDALTTFAHGIEAVTAVHGTDGPLNDVFAALKGSAVELVTLLFPRTKEFEPVVERLSVAVTDLGIEVRRALLPASMDVISFCKSVTEPGHELRQVVRAAAWVSGTRAKKTPLATQEGPSEPVSSLGPSIGASPIVERAKSDAGQGDELVFSFDDRRWRVRGLNDNKARGTLKVNVLVTRADGFHVDTFDLYSSRHRSAFIRQAGVELGLDEAVIKKDLGQVLLQLEQAQEDLLRRLHAPAQKTHEMSEGDREAALALLRSPTLISETTSAFRTTGIVGEEANLTIAFLASISRKLRQPLAVVVQSSSAAGKSSLLDAVLGLVPEEDRHSFSAMTGQSLYYMSGTGLRNKVLYISEDAGAERAAYSLKLLQSQGALTIASTSKEATTGRLVSQEYRVEGPAAIMMTTTSIDVDEELLSRCLVLTVDESAAQTRRVQEAQRQRTTLEGLMVTEDQEQLVALHQNAQRLLRPLKVVIPFAADIRYPDHRVRARRDQRKLLGLVEASALLHQHQRQVRTTTVGVKNVEYVEASRDDLDLAERLLRDVGALGTGDVPPQTEKLVTLIEEFAAESHEEEGSFRFSRRQLRERIGWGDTQLWTHLRRLVELELLGNLPSGKGRGILYELHVRPRTFGVIRGRFGVIRPHIRA